MNKNILLSCLLSSSLLMAACSTPGQNVYDFKEARQSVIVEFGTVVDKSPIKIKGPNSGVGGVTGAVAGGALGSNVGGGDGAIVGLIGGVVVGAVAGSLAEQAIQDKTGYMFTITTEYGKTITVPQYFHKDEKVINVNDRVMVQTSGSYQRVLPANHLPTQINRPKGIAVTD